MSALRGPSVELVAPVLIGYLSKIRGTPAQRIVDVLVAHGIVRRARAGLAPWPGTRRARSAWVLGVMRIRDAVAEVLPRLQDRDRGVAVTAARSLGMLGDAEAADELLRSVAPARRGRGDLPVWVVVEALVGLDAGAADAVGRALDADDPSTRTAAAMTAGRAQHLSLRPLLRERLEHERQPVVLAALAEALGALGDPADVGPLAGLVADDHPRSVRLAAARALGELGDDRARTALGALLADTDPRVGELAADVLVGLGPAGVAEVERRALEPESAAAADLGLAMHSFAGPPGGADGRRARARDTGRRGDLRGHRAPRGHCDASGPSVKLLSRVQCPDDCSTSSDTWVVVARMGSRS
uniref:HEAT repeat domain-containing protein n=1 Tax=Janibacter anophelis TaxID=319054 RepID=UPI0013B04F0D